MSICFGPEVSEAERLQQSAAAKQIRVSAEIYDELDEDVQEEFEETGTSYTATDLTFPKLDRKREEGAARAGKLGAAVEGGRVVVTTNAPATPGTWYNSKPWGGG